MAVRVPVPAALEIIWRGAHDVVEVTDDEIGHAIRAYHDDTHQLAEGAGAAPLAALLAAGAAAGTRAAVILCGGNIDRDVYRARASANERPMSGHRAHRRERPTQWRRAATERLPAPAVNQGSANTDTPAVAVPPRPSLIV